MVADILQQSGSRPPASVFLSYSHNDPNAEVVRAVHNALTGRHNVFCDVGLQPGALWEAETEARLAEADYFVVFLSSQAKNTSTLTEEIRRAVKRKDETGRPLVLPVMLAYDIDDLGMDLGRLVRPFHSMVWQTPEDTGDLIDDLEKVLAGAWAPSSGELAPALSRYLISATRNKRIREAFVPPPDVETARRSIRSGRILWITGAAGAGKQFLASALACELDQPAFELRRTLTWRHILQHRPYSSVVVLPDALAPERAGTGDYAGDLSTLRRICETDNAILLTCTDEEYSMRTGDLIDAGFTPAQLARYRLTDHTYSLSLRVAIVRNLVAQSHAAGIVSVAQQQWVEKILTGQQLPWKNWALSELESLVTRSLPTTTGPSDIVQLLDRHTTVEDDVHVWFLGLDEAARSLLLTLFLFPENTSEQLWARFRAILSELETRRLVPQMSIPTLGVCRARCAPYVTPADNLEIVDPDIVAAIAHELAVSWREYIIELRGLLSQWALPPAGQDRAVTRLGADESSAVRQSVARLLGELLKIRVEDMLPFLEDFATFDQSAIRRAAAESIVYAFDSENGTRNARKLLRLWDADRSGENAAVRKREVAADACWRIAARGSGSPNYAFALEQLQRHIRDVPRVRSVVAFGIGKIVNRRNIDDLQPLMTRLARDQDVIVRRRTGVALSEFVRRDPDAAHAVFADWVASKDTRRLWTAAYSLLIAPNPGKEDRGRLHGVMELDAAAFAEALASSLTPGDEVKDKDWSEYAIPNFLRLIADTESRRRCATALGSYWAANRDRAALLCERLGGLSSKSVNESLVDAYRCRLLEAPSVSHVQEIVLADVSAGGARRQTATSAVAKIVSELTDEFQLDDPIAEAWREAPALFERFLRWLRTDLGDNARPAIVLLRRLIFKSLFLDSEQLVNCAASWLKDAAIKDEGNDAIQAILNAPESWAGLVAPLTIEYWSLRSDVWLILRVFDPRSSTAVRRVAFEGLLREDPRRFIAMAIEETQDFKQVRAEVLKALADIAKTRGGAITAAVRHSVSAFSRRRILTLIHDFSVSDTPLKKVAADLWPTKLWLSLQQFFSTSDP